MTPLHAITPFASTSAGANAIARDGLPGADAATSNPNPGGFAALLGAIQHDSPQELPPERPEIAAPATALPATAALSAVEHMAATEAQPAQRGPVSFEEGLALLKAVFMAAARGERLDLQAALQARDSASSDEAPQNAATGAQIVADAQDLLPPPASASTTPTSTPSTTTSSDPISSVQKELLQLMQDTMPPATPSRSPDGDNTSTQTLLDPWASMTMAPVTPADWWLASQAQVEAATAPNE